MKNLFFVLIIFLFILNIGTTTVNCQSNAKTQEVIRLEIIFEEDSEIKREIDIPFKEKFGIGGRSKCSNCDNKLEEYEFGANAKQIKRDKFRVTFEYIYPRKWKSCNFEKIFIVEKDKPSEIKARCGVKIKAYYTKSQSEE